MREITDEEINLLRSIFDKEGETTQEEFEKVISILDNVVLYSIQPRPQSDKYSWKLVNGQYFLMSDQSIFAFSNIMDIYFFSTDILNWPPEEFDTPERSAFTMKAAALAAIKTNRMLIIDYQLEDNKGFLMYNPREDAFSIGVR